MAVVKASAQVRLIPDVHTRLRVAAAVLGETMAEFTTKAIEMRLAGMGPTGREVVKKGSKRRVVEVGWADAEQGKVVIVPENGPLPEPF